MKGFALVLALCALVAPTAQARTAERGRPGCVAASKARVSKGKASAGCRRMPGSAVAVRAVVPMVAASLEAASVPAPDPNPTPSPAIIQPDPPTTPAARLGVVAREWSLVLSRSSLPAGPALVQLQNFGEDAHNLRIERLDGAVGSGFDVPLAEAGEVQKAQGTLAAGDYKIYCALPGHEAQGMRARFTVVQ